MALYLVQHGKSLPKEEDPDQGLSEGGMNEIRRIADVARDYGIRVAAILHSGKKRARQTAEIFADHLSPAEGSHEKTGLKPLDDVTALSGLIDSKPDLMLVGHLPFMERLTGWLITGDADQPVFKFQNGGIVCLDRLTDSNQWVITWSLSPNIG